MRLRARLAAGNDDGFTLAEMMVTIVILGVVGVMLSNWFIAGIKSTMASVGRNDDVFATRNAVEVLTRDIQLAVQNPDDVAAEKITGLFVSGTHNSIEMYTKIDGADDPSLVKWTVTNPGTYNGTLVRTSIAPVVNSTTKVVTWPTANAVSKNMAKGVNNVDDGKIPDIFRFLSTASAGRQQLCTEVTPAPTAAVCASTYASPLNDDGLAAWSTPNRLATDNRAVAAAVEVYLQVASAGDGQSGTNAPYFETSKKTGNPLVVRTRLYPLVNTVNTTTGT